MTELHLRKQIIATALRMNSLGINRGKSGNVSARWKDGFLVTPSELPYEETKPTDIVFIDGKAKAKGKRAPSSEWRFHFDIYRHKSDVNAVVHTHSSFATTLACLGMAVPAFHYMVAVAGGNSIRCAPYATFGTQTLSDNALGALGGRKACLLANHGMIATGESLQGALALAVEVEALCEQYWRALQIGKPDLLSDDEMAVVVEKFKTYNTQAR
ncbi:MAG: class II aldolase/adducin family protein [Betaproteobacteria bacterium]|nr:class II aldolase/adducin family protein [Betaproteobacteria bacterium]